MFSVNKFKKIKYDYNIKLDKPNYKISKMYEKFILKLYKNNELKFVTYLPNIKYKNTKFRLKSNQNRNSKRYTGTNSSSFSIYNEYTFFDFLNISDEVITFVGNTIEDFTEQRNQSILFYIHKTLLLCEDLVEFSPILSIYCSNLLQICDKLFHRYESENNIDFSTFFIELFENLYNDLIVSIESTIEIIDSTFIEYEPKLFEIKLPKSKVLLRTIKKEEINKEEQKKYKTRYYTSINNSKEIFYIHNISEFVNVCLYYFISNKIAIRKCINCNNYFISKRRDTMFCNFPSPQNPKRSCADVRNHLNQRQKGQNTQIQKLYDNISSIFVNNKDKNEYRIFWKKFRQLYKEKQNDIIYQKYDRKDMIKWLNAIKSDPLQLIEEKENSLNFIKVSDSELEEELKILGLI